MLNKKEFTGKIAKRVKELRNQKKISQEELAHQAQLYRTYINHIESGRYSPSAYVLYKISQALGVKLSKFFDF